MVTGDNVNTALSVAKECRLIAQGKPVIIVKGSVNPETKAPELAFYWQQDDAGGTGHQDQDQIHVNLEEE